MQARSHASRCHQSGSKYTCASPTFCFPTNACFPWTHLHRHVPCLTHSSHAHDHIMPALSTSTCIESLGKPTAARTRSELMHPASPLPLYVQASASKAAHSIHLYAMCAAHYTLDNITRRYVTLGAHSVLHTTKLVNMANAAPNPFIHTCTHASCPHSTLHPACLH
jgi:hypothetical protein